MTNSALPKAKLFTCDRCTLTAGDPIVRAVSIPTRAGHGRCANPHACARRVRKISEEKRGGATTKRKGPPTP
jgi:hypothetical protein